MKNKKVMVITAHPDDETYCSGTLAKLADDGNHIMLVIATSGNRGTIDPAVNPADLAQTRQKEMAAAAEILGIQETIWLGYDDGGLFEATDLKEKMFKVIRQYRPDVVFTFDPWKRYDFHSDHRAVGFAATEAAYLGRCCWYYPQHMEEGFTGHTPSEVYLYQPEESTVEVDVSSYLTRKLDAVAKHASQFVDSEMNHIMRIRNMLNGGSSEALRGIAQSAAEISYIRELCVEQFHRVHNNPEFSI